MHKGPFITVLSLTCILATALAQPSIRSFSRSEDGRVTLVIAPAGDPGEVLDIFYTDNMAMRDWRLAAGYLRVDGRSELTWTEQLLGATPDAAGTRFFRLGRADLDQNENGIPDARETMTHVHDLPAHARARWARAGLPDNTPPDFTNIVNVKTYGAKGDGISDDTAAIAQAISKAPPESVVYFPAGVYRVTQRLYPKSNMILRGDGPELTSILFEGPGTADRCIGIARWDSQQTTTYVAVTDGMEQGSIEIFLASVDGLEPGDIIEIEEDNDPEWGLNDTWQQRLAGQINRVIQVDHERSSLTLDRHLRHTFTAARNPRLRKLYTINNVGIENLFLQRKDAIDGYTIEMKFAVNAWVRNVESFKTYKSHIWIDRSFECEVSESYFHDAHVFGSGGQGYGVACGKHTSDCLIENNIFRLLRHSMIVGSGANGNVYGYNFSTQRALDPVRGTPQPDISVHGNYVFMNLFEGNVVEDADMPDWYWPAGPGNTLLRNRIVNTRTAIDIGSDLQNVLGNVLPNGVITESASLQGVIDYGNLLQGEPTTLRWPGCDCESLAHSFYRSVPPPFMIAPVEYAWPAIGFDVIDGDAVPIPAMQRFIDGRYVP